MEADKPLDFHLHLFPRLEKVGRFLGSLTKHFAYPIPDCASNHYHPLDTPVEPVTKLPYDFEEYCQIGKQNGKGQRTKTPPV